MEPLSTSTTQKSKPLFQPIPSLSQDQPITSVSIAHWLNVFNLTYFAEITEMLPGILNQLGPESLTHLKKLANNVTKLGPDGKGEDEDVPGWKIIKDFF